MTMSLETVLPSRQKRKFLLRVTPAIAIFTLSALLLFYSWYFLHTFQLRGFVTSYFLWSFGVHYDTSSSVMKLFYLGQGVSIFFLLASVVAIYFLAPKREANVSFGAPESKEFGPVSTEAPPAQETFQSSKDGNVNTLRTILSLIRRRDFLRVAPACVILIFSGLLIFYSYLFLQVFDVHGVVTSYFPWSFGKVYTASSSATSQYDLGLGASAGLGIASAAYLASLAVANYSLRMKKVFSLPRKSAPSVSALTQEQELAPQVALPPEPIQEPIEEEEPNENFVFQISERSQQRAAQYLRRKIGSKSRIGAIFLLLLSAILLAVSYKFPNILAEVDSVVAFLAALILIYRDTTHSVQLRVVDRILDSSRAQISELSTFRIPSGYIHELKGEKVTDVVLVFASNHSNSAQPDSGQAKPELTPPGRSLAQLFLRELGKTNPELQDLKSAMQPIFSESLGLSLESNLDLNSEESVTATIAQPVIKIACDDNPNENYSLSCVVCSLLAVLICFTTKRRVSIVSCRHDSKEVTKIEFHLEPLPAVEEQKVEN